MPPNPFNRACRYLLRSAAALLLPWLLRLDSSAMCFEGWLDTRLTLPGHPERTCDTIAHISRLDQGGMPWAIPVEFQIEPDSVMFGRAMVYGGMLYEAVKPSPERGDRFQVIVVIVNLTGVGKSGRRMVWREGCSESTMLPEEWNLSTESAADILEGIARGEVPSVVLAWIPLMKGGGDPGIIQRWLEIAGQVSDPRLRADLALARVFAEAVDRQDVWNTALEGWNVKQSQTVLGWINEGKLEGKIDMLLRMLRKRLGILPEDVEKQIRDASDSSLLDIWMDQFATAQTLDEVRSRLNA